MAYWIGWSKGWPRRKKDCIGRWTRSRREMTNGLGVIPAGMYLKVEDNRGQGLSLTGQSCSCCKLEARIARVNPSSLDLMAEGWEPGDLQLEEGAEDFRWEGEWFTGERLIDRLTMEPRNNHSVSVTGMSLRAARDRQGPHHREPDLVRTVRRSDGYVVWEFDHRVDRFTRVPHAEIAERDGAVFTEGD